MSDNALWEKFKRYYFSDAKLGFALDISRVNFSGGYFAEMQEKCAAALALMAALEKGEIANPDEKRMVGHYWLRNPDGAPSSGIKGEISSTLQAIKDFAQAVHSGKFSPENGGKFKHILLVGIGGSALGPQFVTQALCSADDPLDIYFFDNTDADGMQKVLTSIPDLTRTLCIVISKSGGTKETRNGMLVAKEAWTKTGLDFSKAFIAITCPGSELDKVAEREGWLKRFPMWDWVGGRTSELSAVGLVAAALQGFNIDDMLRGAREMDNVTRNPEPGKNPALLLALMWYQLGGGRGQKDMVVLPYNDRLELFSRYLQQLVMESLGKEKDLAGKAVNQGLAVYGNKGSTDQHAYVQQLRDGLNNFFAVFIQVLRDRSKKTLSELRTHTMASEFSAAELEVEPGVTCGDYLSGFYQGTRKALYDSGRESISITIDEVNEFSVGMLIALFERAVGYYASFVNINAYHQPGVEAGKKAAADVLTLQGKVLECLQKKKNSMTVSQIASDLGSGNSEESIFLTLRHLAANSRVRKQEGGTLFDDAYSV